MESEILKDVRKALVKHFLHITVLGTLRHQSPLSGYDLLAVIHSRFNIMISSGTVYSILYHLEHEGLITGETTDRKRVYELTGKGQEFINCILESEKEIVGFLETILKS